MPADSHLSGNHLLAFPPKRCVTAPPCLHTVGAARCGPLGRCRIGSNAICRPGGPVGRLLPATRDGEPCSTSPSLDRRPTVVVTLVCASTHRCGRGLAAIRHRCGSLGGSTVGLRGVRPQADAALGCQGRGRVVVAIPSPHHRGTCSGKAVSEGSASQPKGRSGELRWIESTGLREGDVGSHLRARRSLLVEVHPLSPPPSPHAREAGVASRETQGRLRVR